MTQKTGLNLFRLNPAGLGGLYWTRTSDPIDVNDVLYQLSQQTKHIGVPIFVRSIQVTFLAHCPSAEAVESSFGRRNI